MACEEAETITARYVPHPHCTITRAREDVEIVGMEGHTVDIVVMADINAQGFDVVC